MVAQRQQQDAMLPVKSTAHTTYTAHDQLNTSLILLAETARPGNLWKESYTEISILDLETLLRKRTLQRVKLCIQNW